MKNRIKQYADKHLVEITVGTVFLAVAANYVFAVRVGAAVGAQEATRVMNETLRKGVPLVAHLNDQEIAANILKGIKDIKRAEKAAKIAKDVVL